MESGHQRNSRAAQRPILGILVGVGLAGALAGCGGGGGSSGAANVGSDPAGPPSLACFPGLVTGFAGAIGDAILPGVSPQAGINTTGEGGSGDGGGVGGGDGEGAGGSDGQYANVNVTIETAVGGRSGPWPVDAAKGMVTFVPCAQKPPMRLRFSGDRPDAVYYDEGTRQVESFAGRERFGLVTVGGRNHGVTPLSHALYLRVQQIGKERGLDQGWHDPAVIEQAHRELLDAINDQLPGLYRIEDLTRLPVMLNSGNDVEGSNALTPNANGIYGAVVAGLSLVANTNLAPPGGGRATALALGDALAADLADGQIDLMAGDGSALATPARTPYSRESLWAQLTVGSGVMAQKAGVDWLKASAVPIGYVRAKAPAPTPGAPAAPATGATESLYALGSGGNLVVVPNPDAGGQRISPAPHLKFSQLYRFGPDTVVALRRDGLGLVVFPAAWDGNLALEVPAPASARIVEMFDAGQPVMRLADGSLMRLEGSGLVPEAAPAGMLNATCRKEFEGAMAGSTGAALGPMTGTVCYGPSTAATARLWRQGGDGSSADMPMPRVVQVSGNQQVVLGLQADGTVLQLDADQAVRYTDANGAEIQTPTAADQRQLVAAGSAPKRIELPRVCWLRAPFAIGCDGSAWALNYREYHSASGEFLGAGPVTGVRPLPIPTPVWRTRANRRLTAADAEMASDAVFIGVNGRVYDMEGRPLDLPLDGLPGSIPTQPPEAPGLTVVAGDDVLTRSEAAAELPLVGDAQPGSQVDIRFGAFSGATQADGQRRWSLPIPAAALPKADGTVAIEVTATNVYGKSPPTRRNIRVVLSEAAAPTISAVAGDDVVSPAEAAATVTVSGSAEAGARIAVGWGGRAREAVAGGGGGWSVGFAPAELPPPGPSQVTARASNENGPGGQTSRPVTIQAPVPTTPTIEMVAGDDVVSVEEARAGVTVTGTAPAGSQVTVTWYRTTKQAAAGADGRWSAPFAPTELAPPDTATTVAAIATLNGQRSEPASRPVRMGAAPVASVPPPTIAAIAGDNVISAAEWERGIAVVGRARPGDLITASFGQYRATATTNARGDWGLGLPPIDLAFTQAPAEFTVTATATAGGVTSEPATRSATLARTVPAVR